MKLMIMLKSIRKGQRHDMTSTSHGRSISLVNKCCSSTHGFPYFPISLNCDGQCRSWSLRSFILE
jgi:hypothetical protein